MDRNPFVVDPSSGSPIRSPQTAKTNPSPWKAASNMTYEEDQSTAFQGFPQAHESPINHARLQASPSRAAARYSPQRRNIFSRDSTHNSPLPQQGYLPQNRYQANLQESPKRSGQVVIEVDDYNNEEEDLYDVYRRNGSPVRNGGSLFPPGSRNSSGGSKSLFSEEDYERKSLDDESTIYSGDTFGNTRFQLNHPQFNYIRRGKSEVRRKPPVKNSKNILKLDNPIPGGLSSILPRRDSPEFTEMRYTACTSEPDDFVSGGYSLRFAEMNRECQIAICITMYNEDKYALARTLHSIMKNVAHLCSRKKSNVWGPNGWKKVQVIIVSDGRTKINQGSLDYLSALGVYQEDMAKSTVNGEAVKAHIFELTTQVSIDDELDYVSKGIVPVQIVFCLKEENQKKINSHRWLFNAFCPILDPTVVALVDVGTRLNSTAVYHLWKVFDMDSNVAGAAGQIKTMKGKWGLKLLNPLVASQNFEYKMSNILDKPLESVFGYISVLPGALSAYRYRALQNHEDGTGPLHSYFLGETQEGRQHDVFTANMYLAEDRILCWELVAKRDAKWVLKYVKEATGETDVPEEPPEFISQRRRWLNGAMFAALYAQLHFTQIWKTKHSATRKLFFHIEFSYQFVQMVFSWFSIANFFLTFYYLAGSMNKIIKHGEVLFTFFKYLIICDLAALFIISMGNRPQGANHLFIISMVILSICSTYALICGLVFSIQTLNDGSESHMIFVNIVVSLLSTYGLYAFTSIMYLDPWHLVTSSIQYFLMLPSFICTLQIFAFCNTHDVSWGTKGSTQEMKPKSEATVKEGPDGQQIVEGTEWPQEIDKKFAEIKSRLKENEIEEDTVDLAQMKNDYYRDIRTRIVMIWMLSNLVLMMIITQIYAPEETSNNKYLAFILWSVAALAAFRALGSMSFLFMKYLRMIVSFKHKAEDSGSLNFPSVTGLFKSEEKM